MHQSWIHNNNASVFFFIFSLLSRMHSFVFEVTSIFLIDQYQDATSRAASLHELKKTQLQMCFLLMTHYLNALHECCVAERQHWVCMEPPQLGTEHEKNACIISVNPA